MLCWFSELLATICTPRGLPIVGRTDLPQIQPMQIIRCCFVGSRAHPSARGKNEEASVPEAGPSAIPSSSIPQDEDIEQASEMQDYREDSQGDLDHVEGGDGEPSEDAVFEADAYLRMRLHDVRSDQARSMELRPQLQKVHDGLLLLLTAAVKKEGRNNSMLLLGERGSGKTLVRNPLTLFPRVDEPWGTGSRFVLSEKP